MNGINRMEFLGRQVGIFLVAFSVTFLAAMAGGDVEAVGVVVQLVCIPFNLYWCAQRCDNIGWSRWLVLILFVPFIGFVFFLMLFFAKGQEQELELVTD